MRKRLVAVGSVLALLLSLSSCSKVQAQLYTYVCKTFTMAGARPAPCQAPAGLHTVKDTGGTPSDSVSVVTTATCTFTNGVEWGALCQPYSPTGSLWNRKMSNTTNPTLIANSASIISTAEAQSNRSPMNLLYSEGGSNSEVSHPIYFATGGANDVQVNTACRTFCSGWTQNNNGPTSIGVPATVWVPKKARPAGGSIAPSDNHMAVVQPNGDEIDCWVTQQNGTYPIPRDWQTGDTWSCGNSQNVGKFLTGVGQMGNGLAVNAATAGGNALAAGLVREAELANHLIPHALFLTTNCVGSGFVFPGIEGGDNICTGSNPLLFGYHLWFPMSDTAIDALSVDRDTKTVMHAFHQYGGYIMDSGGSGAVNTDGVYVMMEAGSYFSAYGNTNPFDTYTSTDSNWVTDPNAAPPAGKVLLDTSGLNWSSSNNLRIVDPCYAQGTC